MKTSSRIIILAAVMMLAAGNLHAQGATAAISGTVLDPTGAAIPGASISVRNVGTAFTRSVISDDQGRYVAPELPIGEYEVQASLAGFQTVVRRGIPLTVGSRPVIDLQLPIGQAEETISVTGDLSQVETTSSSVSSLVNQTQMRELPLNGRNFEQLILLAPGALSYPAGGSSALVGRAAKLHLHQSSGALKRHASHLYGRQGRGSLRQSRLSRHRPCALHSRRLEGDTQTHAQRGSALRVSDQPNRGAREPPQRGQSREGYRVHQRSSRIQDQSLLVEPGPKVRFRIRCLRGSQDFATGRLRSLSRSLSDLRLFLRLRRNAAVQLAESGKPVVPDSLPGDHRSTTVAGTDLRHCVRHQDHALPDAVEPERPAGDLSRYGTHGWLCRLPRRQPALLPRLQSAAGRTGREWSPALRKNRERRGCQQPETQSQFRHVDTFSAQQPLPVQRHAGERQRKVLEQRSDHVFLHLLALC